MSVSITGYSNLWLEDVEGTMVLNFTQDGGEPDRLILGAHNEHEAAFEVASVLGCDLHELENLRVKAS